MSFRILNAGSTFGNKDQLFDTVFDALVVTIMHDVPIDASDLAAMQVDFSINTMNVQKY